MGWELYGSPIPKLAIEFIQVAGLERFMPHPICSHLKKEKIVNMRLLL